MGKRGRPAGVDSSVTRKRILDAARSVFSMKGYDGASILKIAETADLVPSAIYHHFENKETLYMAVFEDTADAIWGSVSLASEEKTLVEAFSHLIESSRKIADDFPGHSAFLGAMPHEARFHPDYEKLMNRRAEFQDQTFQSLASLGKRTGEFPELSESELKEVIRCLVMGWFFERHFRHAEIPGSGDSIAKFIRVIT
ncbi:MAG: hypothetical protein CL448_02970 [Acidimicrobiaceae bacterium]|nr:hypothetical protein [Acidimicrobiaceae bacterium]